MLSNDPAAFTMAPSGAVQGYAACWGGPADAAKDIMAPGALGKLATMPAMLREHLPGVPVGQWTEVTSDEIGIRVSGVITDKTALADVRAGRLTGLSCGFHTLKSRPKGDGLRQIDLVDLKEISLAKNPVSSRARILTVKSATAAQGVTMDYETNTGAADEAVLETKSMTDAIAEAVASAVAPIAARLDKFESVARRPGVAPALETKGAAIDREAHALAHFCRTGSDLEIKSASVSVDPSGGYAVLPQLDLTIRKVARDITPMRALANTVSLSSDSYEILVDASQADATWVDEAGDRVETDAPVLIKINIPAHEIYAAPRATQKLIDDAAADVGGWLTSAISDRFARSESTAFVSGNGVGKPRGFLSYPTASTVDFTRAWGNIQYVASGGASTLTADGLVALSMALRAPYRQGAAFLMNRATATTVRQMKDGQNRYLWDTDGSVVNGSPDTLLGFPVVLSEDMPAIGAGTFPIALASWRQAYTIVDRHGVRLIRDNLTAKPYIVFYAYKRVGGDVTDFNAIKLLKVAAS